MYFNYLTLDEASVSGCPMMLGTIDYLQNFLAKPHASLEVVGHKGTVCPFTSQVLKNETVSFAREIVDVSNPDAILKIKKSLLDSHLKGFFNIIEPQVEEKNKKLACLLVVVYGLCSARITTRFCTDGIIAF